MSNGTEPAAPAERGANTPPGSAEPPWRVLTSLPAIIAECLVVVFVVVIVAGRNYSPDARLFPTIVASLGLVLCAIFLGTMVLNPDYARRVADDREEASGNARGFWVACITPPIYCLAIYLVGFHAATFVAMLVMPRLLGYRGWLRLTGIALGTVLVL